MQKLQGAILSPEMLPDHVRAPQLDPAVAPAPLTIAGLVQARLLQGGDGVWASVHAEMERALIEGALSQSKGNQRLAAKRLGLADHLVLATTPCTR